jgi:hypothetical protein
MHLSRFNCPVYFNEIKKIIESMYICSCGKATPNPETIEIIATANIIKLPADSEHTVNVEVTQI